MLMAAAIVLYGDSDPLVIPSMHDCEMAYYIVETLAIVHKGNLSAFQNAGSSLRKEAGTEERDMDDVSQYANQNGIHIIQDD